jgi:hypothetical protein
MNRSIIERMVREGDLSIDALQYLLQCHCECEWLDYKEDLPLERDKQLCEFAKDVIAQLNQPPTGPIAARLLACTA